MRHRSTAVLAACALIILSSGCELLTGPDTRRVMGRIGDEESGYVPLEAPDTVTTGTPFEVVFHQPGDDVLRLKGRMGGEGAQVGTIDFPVHVR